MHLGKPVLNIRTSRKGYIDGSSIYIYTTKGALCAQKLGNGISYHHFFYTELVRYCPH